MTITPDQAHELLDGAMPGPWHVHTDPGDPDGTFIYDETGNMCISVSPAGSAYREADLTLAAAAPDLAQTIAEMEYEYAAQVKEGGEWFYIGLYGPDEPWGPEEDVREYQVRCQIPGARLVRRMIGPAETVGDLV